MNKPIFKGWIDRLPDVNVNVNELLTEYKNLIEPKMAAVTDQNNQVLVQCRYRLSDDDIVPNTQKVIDILKKSFDFTHVTYRIVMPNTAYNWHYDVGQVCYHIPLLTNKGCWFVFENRSFSMPADGGVYIVNNGRMHTFVNAGATPRLHLTFEIFEANNSY